jgi:alcohol dehydrogenase class IV
MALIHESLEKAVNHPDLEHRSKMLIASLMGAVAFQKGLGVVHSLAHPLSSLLDTHHGLANAVNIPYGMEFNIMGSEHKFKQIARALQIEKQTGEEVVRYLFELNERIHIPRKLAAIGVKPEHIETLSGLALADFAHPNNPKPVNRENFKQLYMKAL